MSADSEVIYQKMEEEFTVSERKSVYGVSAVIFGMGFFVLVAEIMFHNGPSVPVWAYLIILGIFLSASACLLVARNHRVEVKNGDFCSVTMLGGRKRFSLNDIGYVKAAANAKAGQDYFHIYDKNGKRLCRLEFHMNNSFLLLRYLYDNGITVDTSKDPGEYLSQIVMQVRIPREDIPKVAEEACHTVGKMLTEWQEKNPKIGAEFLYGLVQYHGERILPEEQIQPPDSRISLSECEELAGDYLCMIEIYLQKEGLFIKDKKGNFLLMTFPIIYRQKSAALGEWDQICYNQYYEEEVRQALHALKTYLPGRRFVQEKITLGYELKKRLSQ